MAKQLRIEMCTTARELVEFVNSKELQKEDILAIKDVPTPFTIFYYE